MKGWTIMFETGWCGFGRAGGLMPELRLGVVRIAWCRGQLIARLAKVRDALEAAVRGIGA